MNKELFIQHLQDLGINLSDMQLQKLDLYYKLLIEENKKYNLTAITSQDDVYLKHFYDSLTTIKIINLEDQQICDIGTGAGFPGIVLKIAFPNLKLTLIDATLKKCNFLKLVVEKLKLDNVTIINSRIEDYAKNHRECYDIVICRAVACLKHLLEYATPLLKVKGNLICLKGNVENEISDLLNYYLKLNITLKEKIMFKLPIEQSTRTLLKFEKQKITDLKYPRSYNEIKKREL